MKSISFDHVIFDLGNVLFKWQPEKVADSISCPEILQIVDSFYWQEFDRGAVSKEELIEMFSPKFPKIEIFLDKAMESLKPIPETLTIFYRCQEKGYSLFILSNLSFSFREFLLKKYDFLSQVKGAIYSCDVGYVKPDPKIYESLIQHYSLNSNRSLFLDDRQENIEGARPFGICGMLFNHPQNCFKNLISMGVI